MGLTRGAIVEAGLSILDRYGLGDLSMRRVAEVLGVQAGALYYHVPNKQSLLAALADDVLLAVPDPTGESEVEGWLCEWAEGLRAALLSRRDGAELVASSLALGLGTLDPATAVEARLESAGAPEPGATARALVHFVLGHAVTEQTRAQMRDLGVLEDFDAARSERDFHWGVSVIVRGALRVEETKTG